MFHPFSFLLRPDTESATWRPGRRVPLVMAAAVLLGALGAVPPVQAGSAAVMMSVESVTIRERGEWYTRKLAIGPAVRDSGLMAPERTRIGAIHWRYHLPSAPGEWQVMLCQASHCALLDARRGKLTLPETILATAPFSLRVYRNGRGVLAPAAQLEDIQLVLEVESLG